MMQCLTQAFASISRESAAAGCLAMKMLNLMGHNKQASHAGCGCISRTLCGCALPFSMHRKTAITTRILSLVHELCLKQINVTKRDLFYTDVKLFEVSCCLV
jgi:DNA topoisomerase VI subunit A